MENDLLRIKMTFVEFMREIREHSNLLCTMQKYTIVKSMNSCFMKYYILMSKDISFNIDFRLCSL